MASGLRILLIFCIILAIPLAGDAGIYKYRDADGRLTFVDDESKIPVQYREKATVMGESNDSPMAYDNDAAEITLPKDAEEPEETAWSSPRKQSREYQTPVVIKGNRVLVPVELFTGNRSVELSLLLDTGATRTVFHRQSLTSLTLPKGKLYKARVAGGGIVKSRKMIFSKLKVGPFEISKANAMVINLNGKPLPYDGMLGMDFLKSHPYQIDFDQQLITWERPER